MTDADRNRKPGESVHVSGLSAKGHAHQFLVADGNMTVQAPPPPALIPVPRQLPMDVTAFTTERHCEALRMAREFTVIDSELTILNDLALTFTAQNRLEEAIEHHRLAHGMARQHGNQLELQRAKDGLRTLTEL